MVNICRMLAKNAYLLELDAILCIVPLDLVVLPNVSIMRKEMPEIFDCDKVVTFSFRFCIFLLHIF